MSPTSDGRHRSMIDRVESFVHAADVGSQVCDARGPEKGRTPETPGQARFSSDPTCELVSAWRRPELPGPQTHNWPLSEYEKIVTDGIGQVA